MKNLLPYLLAIAAGIFTTLEAAINSKLGKATSPKVATLHSLFVGLLFMLVINIFSGTLSEYNKVFEVKLQWLIGGIFGAMIIYAVTKSVNNLGVSTTVTMVIAAQIISSFYIDVFVLKEQQLDLGKLLGIILILLGVYFIIE